MPKPVYIMPVRRPPTPPLFPEHYTAEYLERRRREVAKREKRTGGLKDSGPKCPAGHARGIRISVSITSNYRQTHRKLAMDIKPQDVINVLQAAGVKKWVLMGLHGYVGYLPEPRATQDVDVLVSHRDRKRAVKAVRAAWPMLIVDEQEAVVRFQDPNDRYADGRPKTVIDLMLPWSIIYHTILKEKGHFIQDAETGHFIPTVEAALASKYAAMISDARDITKKQYDAADFRLIARANFQQVDRNRLRHLGDAVWPGGGAELESFFDVAQTDKPFLV